MTTQPDRRSAAAPGPAAGSAALDPLRRVKLLFAGVGGQGVISIARRLGLAALEAGLPVRVGQLHGMSQRGGSVEATVCLGPGETGFVTLGEADVLVGLEPLEVNRALPFLAPGGLLLADCNPIAVPGGALYPITDELRERIAAITERAHVVDARRVAREAGDPRSTNVVMLGALAAFDVLPVGGVAIRRAVEAATPARLAAFDAGWEMGRREAQRDAGEELWPGACSCR